jgi:NodT family efflux transporter outer membrane factor (OMF) lipoprotein
MSAVIASRIALALALAALAGCTVGPDYKRAPAATTPAFKELDGWKPATPGIVASGAPWWSIYDDTLLSSLEQQVVVSNETLKADLAAYNQATAIVDEARAGYYPTVTATASAQRSGTTISSNSSFARANATGSITQSSFSAVPAVTWAPDIWGRVRRLVESDVAAAQASAADLAAAQLSLQTTLATDYFQLRVADEQKRVLEQSVAAYQRSLDITKNQYAAGVAAETDVADAETQLETTQAQLIGVDVARAADEHAVAVLIGKAPAEFSIARLPAPLATAIPVVPPGVPSALLERRPDVAAAERAMDEANAEIGVAIAAYYPDFTLSADASFTSTAIQNVLSLANAGWTIGASASETVFDGGLRGAQIAAARDAYDENVATYRAAVLTAFQQVEDDLAALRVLEAQAKAEDAAVATANRAVELTLNQYQAGTVAYTSVVVAQTTALSDELTALTILQSRLVASANLVMALGGGWDSSQLPKL